MIGDINLNDSLISGCKFELNFLGMNHTITHEFSLSRNASGLGSTTCSSCWARVTEAASSSVATSPRHEGEGLELLRHQAVEHSYQRAYLIQGTSCMDLSARSMMTDQRQPIAAVSCTAIPNLIFLLSQEVQ